MNKLLKCVLPLHAESRDFPPAHRRGPTNHRRELRAGGNTREYRGFVRVYVCVCTCVRVGVCVCTCVYAWEDASTILEKSLSYKEIGPIYLENQSILKTSEGFVIYIEFPFVCHQARFSSSYQ